MRAGFLAAFCLISAAAFAAPAPGSRQPASVYPFDADDAQPADVKAVEALVKGCLTKPPLPNFPLSPAPGGALAATCGRLREANPACLARLAGSGLLLGGVVSRSGGLLFIELTAYDRAGTRSGPVRTVVDQKKLNPGPIAESLRLLAEKARAPAPAPVVADAPVPPPNPATTDAAPAAPASAPTRAPEPPAPVAAVSPPPPVPPAATSAVAPAAASHTWLAAALGGAGLIALGGSLYFAQSARGIDADLRARYEAALLRPADRPAYDELRRDSTTANVLLVSGVALAAAGGGLFGYDLFVAPGAVGASRRF